jgi:hypothetical protein
MADALGGAFRRKYREVENPVPASSFDEDFAVKIHDLRGKLKLIEDRDLADLSENERQELGMCMVLTRQMFDYLSVDKKKIITENLGSPSEAAAGSRELRFLYARGLLAAFEKEWRERIVASAKPSKQINSISVSVLPFLAVAAFCVPFAMDLNAVDEDWAKDIAGWTLSILGVFYGCRLFQEKRPLLGLASLIAAVAHNQIRPIDFDYGQDPWVFGWTAGFAAFLAVIQWRSRGEALPSIYRR